VEKRIELDQQCSSLAGQRAPCWRVHKPVMEAHMPVRPQAAATCIYSTAATRHLCVPPATEGQFGNDRCQTEREVVSTSNPTGRRCCSSSQLSGASPCEQWKVWGRLEALRATV